MLVEHAWVALVKVIFLNKCVCLLMKESNQTMHSGLKNT